MGAAPSAACAPGRLMLASSACWWKRNPQFRTEPLCACSRATSPCSAEHQCAIAPRKVSVTKSACSCRIRSEEHTSELQSHVNLVCRLLLEKKNQSHVPNTSHYLVVHC